MVYITGETNTSMATEDRRREAQHRARQVYGEGSAQLRYPTLDEAKAASGERDAILARIGGRTILSCSGTKLASGSLAPGCEICVAGVWSCLFINERCNTRCFYCPAPQEMTSVPMTNSVPFPRTDEYLEYLARFAFRGVSISGGEPLLTLDRTLRFIRAVKRRFAGHHVWLYTNGTLLEPDIVKRLRDAGLDEIRFGIGATSYHLDRVQLAVGAIRHVTVEIPAVPEDHERLEQTLVRMASLGVSHLNLHQLRLTRHNFSKLVDRGYTFIHGDNASVLESELTALRLMEHALDAGIELPVNYCSYVYKHRFQRAAARRHAAGPVLRTHEGVTAGGYIRTLTLRAGSDAIAAAVARLGLAGVQPASWTAAGDRLSFAAELWPVVCPAPTAISVAYIAPRILPGVTYRNPFVELPLGKGRKIAVERVTAGPELELDAADAEALRRQVLEGHAPDAGSGSPSLHQALVFEAIETGMQDYF